VCLAQENSNVSRVPRLDDKAVVKISVQEACKTGWIKQLGNDRLELFQIDPDHIALRVNGQLTNARFKIAEQTISNNLWRNGFVPAGSVVYFVVDEAGQRFRSLYLYERRFGTRKQLGLRYPVNCMSRRQRRIYSQGYQVRVTLRRDRDRRRQERQSRTRFF
jgi:hypothetical protein